MKAKKNKCSFAADKVTLTSAPEEREMTVNTKVSSLNPLHSNQYYPGDSVDAHQELEEANLDLAEDELRQQNENNALD
ncbi:hypothetical protein SAMN05421736_106112 [Evansella caseinilytica]|uniref:Uncharacterized protein n=1 Tax=Evansella caseinilytica TaxID=1503961 RepID=A0A1H3QCX0_9BACI|nr:hypothetical protein [Evansella caseinilytica]SDZ10981.1 hypothetical protein SAMN05421736_106112 [Evansella caseinilytica]